MALSNLDRLQHAAYNDSVVEDLFTGQLMDARVCDACGRLAASTQQFHILLVPIAKPHDVWGVVRLDDCLELLCAVEQLSGQNGLNCEHCNRTRLNTAVRSRSDPSLSQLSTPTVGIRGSIVMSPIAAAPDRSPTLSDFAPAVTDNRTSTPIPGAPRPSATVCITSCKRRSLIGHAPPCLIIQLMRFVGENGTSRKLKTPVSIPTTGLSLAPLLLEHWTTNGRPASEALYELYAVCLHYGAECSVNGHYLTLAKSTDGQWFRFDDARVELVNIDYELTTQPVRENAYMLFYRLTL